MRLFGGQRSIGSRDLAQMARQALSGGFGSTVPSSARIGGGGGAGGTVTKVAPQAPSPEVTNIFDKLMEQFKPGGEFGKHELDLLARAKKKSLASAAQRMVTGGLSGTTVPMAEESRFKEEEGDPFHARLEGVRTSRLREVMMAKAGYLGGLGGSKTTTTRFGGGMSGGAPIRPQDYSKLPSQQMIQSWGMPRPTAPTADAGPTSFGADIPAGGRIMGDQYFPPTRFTRNIPELTLS